MIADLAGGRFERSLCRITMGRPETVIPAIDAASAYELGIFGLVGVVSSESHVDQHRYAVDTVESVSIPVDPRTTKRESFYLSFKSTY